MDRTALRLIMAGTYLAAISALMWMSLPEWQRRLIAAGMAEHARRAAAAVAAGQGRAGMKAELAGADPEGHYDLAYRLSVARDRLAGVISRLLVP